MTIMMQVAFVHGVIQFCWCGLGRVVAHVVLLLLM